MAADIARIADAAVVGSALVQVIADSLDGDGRPAKDTSAKALAFVGQLAEGVRSARATKGRVA
jgi:tryptophan synthase alpha chain